MKLVRGTKQECISGQDELTMAKCACDGGLKGRFDTCVTCTFLLAILSAGRFVRGTDNTVDQMYRRRIRFCHSNWSRFVLSFRFLFPTSPSSSLPRQLTNDSFPSYSVQPSLHFSNGRFPFLFLLYQRISHFLRLIRDRRFLLLGISYFCSSFFVYYRWIERCST